MRLVGVGWLDFLDIRHPPYTPDPLGDWTNGRLDRLVRAELASVGLRP